MHITMTEITPRGLAMAVPSPEGERIVPYQLLQLQLPFAVYAFAQAADGALLAEEMIREATRRMTAEVTRKFREELVRAWNQHAEAHGLPKVSEG